MLVLYNLRLGLYHSLTNRLAEGLLSAGTILVTQGKCTGQAQALSSWSPE